MCKPTLTTITRLSANTAFQRSNSLAIQLREWPVVLNGLSRSFIATRHEFRREQRDRPGPFQDMGDLNGNSAGHFVVCCQR